MSESYRAHARLDLKSNAAQILSQISRALGTLDGRVRSSQRNMDAMMRAMGVSANGAAQGFDTAARATEGYSRASERAERASRRQTAATESQSRALVRVTQHAAQAERAVAALQATQLRLTYEGGGSGGGLVSAPRMLGYSGGGSSGGSLALAGGGALLASRMAFSGGGGGGRLPPGGGPLLLGGPGGGGGRMAATFAAGLAAMRGIGGGGGGGGSPPGNAGAGAADDGGQGRAGRAASAAAIGYLGYRLMGWVGAALHAGGELQHQQVMLKAAGLDAAAVAGATARAWEVTRSVRGSNVTSNLDLFGGLRGAFTDQQAMQYLPEFARFSQTLGVSLGRDPGKSGEYAAKFLSLRNAFQDPETGQIDPQRGLGELAALQRTIIGTAGRVGPQDFLAFQKQAGISGTRLNPTALYQFMPSLIESMGGHRAGTALAAVSRQIVGGTMTQRVADQMVNLGLLNQRDIEVRRGGSVVVRPGSVRGSRDFAADPFAWIEKVLRPALMGRGYTSQDQQLEVIARLFGTETARRFVSEVLVSAPEIRQNAAMIAGVRADSGSILQGESYRTATANFSASWTNLMTALGLPATGLAITVMDTLAGGLNGLAKWATDNPETAKTVLEVAAALGALGVALAAFALGGAVMAGLSALGSGLTGLAVGLTALGTAVVFATAPIVSLLGFVSAFNKLGSQNDSSPERQELQRHRWRDRARQPGFYGDTPAEGGSIIPQNYSPVPPQGGAQAIPIILNLDGREVGRGVMPWIGREASGPIQSAVRFDNTRALAPAVMT